METKKEIRSIQVKAEKELGILLHRDFWDVIEKAVGNTAEDFEGDPDGEEQYKESYRNVTNSYIKALRSGLLSTSARLSTDHNKKTPQPIKRYRKCFERRFYLVRFVLDRPAYKRGSRIDWKRMVEEWNKSHPSDTMSLSTLRVEYQRAIKETVLMLQIYLTKRNQSLNSESQLIDMKLKELDIISLMNFIAALSIGREKSDFTQGLISYLEDTIRNSPDL